MEVMVPFRLFKKEFGELPKVRSYHNRSRRYSINNVRGLFFQLVFFYYLLLVAFLISTMVFLFTWNPAGYFISLFFSPAPAVLFLFYLKVRKDPDRFARNHLKYSLTGLFTRDHDEFIYGRKRDRGYSIPKEKFRVLIRSFSFIVMYVSVYFLVLIQVPLQVLEGPFRIIAMALTVPLFIMLDIIILKTMRRTLKKRFVDGTLIR